VTDRRPERVYVDANELFPFTIMDVVLALAEDLVVDVVWSEELLDEWQRVIVRDGRRTAESAASVAASVRTFFASGRIDPGSYRHLVNETPGSDPNDRVHTAAAIAGGASVLVTRNRSDFPILHLSHHGVAVMSADEFLSRILRHRPAAVVETIRRMAAEKRRPPLTPCDIAGRLARAGAPTFAGRLGRRLGCDDLP